MLSAVENRAGGVWHGATANVHGLHGGPLQREHRIASGGGNCTLPGRQADHGSGPAVHSAIATNGTPVDRRPARSVLAYSTPTGDCPERSRLKNTGRATIQFGPNALAHLDNAPGQGSNVTGAGTQWL